MNRYERLTSLLEILGERGRVAVDDLSRELDVSPATIRRDLDHLADQQLITRTRGGAVAHTVAYDLPLRYKMARHAPQKQRIALAAARLVSPGTVVGLNGGTTTTEVARAIARRSDLHTSANGRPITVVTNAVNIANELTVRAHVKLVVTGGVARPRSYELVGPLATRILDEIRLDIAILGVDAIDPVIGATAHNEDEANTNRLMASRAQQVVIVGDSSKIGRTAFARICTVEETDILVTDAAASDDAVRVFQEQGIQVLRV